VPPIVVAVNDRNGSTVDELSSAEELLPTVGIGLSFVCQETILIVIASSRGVER
jgi:hypothetical protein